MHDLDLKSLRLLVAVCEHRNIKLAAEQEHIEPSAISKRIGQMEAAMGVALLARHRRGVEPTAAGAALVEHARNMLFTAERIQSDIAAFGRGVRGHVRVVASASAIAESLLDDVAEFMRDEAHRDIQVDIEERLSRDLVRMVADGGASIGVCWANVDFQGLETCPYRRDELALVVPQGHPLARRTRVSFEQSLDYDHVGLPPATAVHSMLARAAAQLGKTIRYRAVVSNFEAELRVVAAGLGISITPRQIAARYEQLYGVRALRLSDPWARRRFAISFRDSVSRQPASMKLVEFLKARAD
jgi:DNA-binding transcriptional LysR family regulator